jgi:hypothetical protein
VTAACLADPPALTGRAAAERFVELLTGAPDNPLVWRAFADPTKKRSAREQDGPARWPAYAVEGTLEEVQPDLHRLQELDYGVYVVVNFGGARGSQIIRIRAVFVDKDGDKHGPAQRWQDVQWHVKPDFLVVDPSDDYHWHAYWLVTPDFPGGRFTSTQKRFAQRYGSDPSVCDLSRVMRVPGFKHLKDGPRARVLVDFTGGAARAVVLKSLDALTAGLPELRNEDGTPARQARPDFELDLDHNVAHSRARLKAWKSAEPGAGNNWTYQAAERAMDFGLSVEKTIEVVGERDAMNPSPRSPEELEITVQHALEYRQNDVGCDAQDEPSLRFAAARAFEAARRVDDEPEDFINLLEEFPAPKFPLFTLPPVLQAYVASQAKRMGVDAAALAMASLGACSGALDHSIQVQMLPGSDWYESACLWILWVAGPGAKKSPVLKEAVRMLRILQKEDLDRHRRAMVTFSARKEALRAKGEPLINADQSVPQPVEQGIWATGEEERHTPEPAKRFLLDDVTIEKVGVILAQQNRGITARVDELSAWLGNMDKYGGHGGTRGTWIQARNGGARSIDRVGNIQGTKTDYLEVENFSVTVLAATQPKKLQKLPDLQDDGLLQRFVVVQMEPACRVQIVDDGPRQELETLVRRLAKLGPARLTLASEAQAQVLELDAYFTDLADASVGGDGFNEFVRKLTSVFGNLLVLLHVIADPDRARDTPVSLATALAARKIIERFVLPSARAFYQTVVDKGSTEEQRAIASAILRLDMPGDRWRQSDFKKYVSQLQKLPDLDLAKRISVVASCGWLVPVDGFGPTKAWIVAKGLKEHFAGLRDLELERAAKRRHHNLVLRQNAGTDEPTGEADAAVGPDSDDW